MLGCINYDTLYMVCGDMKQNNNEKNIAEWAEGQELPNLSALLASVDCPGMSDTQRKILAIKLLPNSHKWTIKKKADIAGICDRTWRRVTRDKKFQSLSVQYVRENLSRNIPEIFTQYCQGAMNGNFIAMERILTQAGVFDKSDSKPAELVLKIEDKRQDNLTKGLPKLGIDIPIDNHDGDVQPS